MFTAHIRRFINGSNHTMDTGDIDNSTPVSLFHMWDSLFSDIPVTTEIKINNLLEFFIWEIFDSSDELHTSIINNNIN